MRLPVLKVVRKKREKKPPLRSKDADDILMSGRVLFIRLGIVICFVMMATVLGACSYILLRQNQVDTFQLQFGSLANRMRSGIYETINSTVAAGFLVNDIYANAVQEGCVGTPPYITLPGFESTMNKINHLAKLRAIRFAPLVNGTTRSKWEAYAKANVKLLKGPSSLNVSFGIWAPGHVHDPGHVVGSPYPDLLFPVWQSAPLASTSKGILSDPHAIPDSRSQTIDLMIATEQYQMTDILPLDVDAVLRPSSVFYTPIKSLDSKNSLIGISIIAFSWDDVFSRNLPTFYGGIDCVLSSKTQTYTISYKNGVLSAITTGDIHDSSFDDYVIKTNDDSSHLLMSISQFQYSISIYPTRSFFTHYVDRFPLLVSIGTVAIVVFTFFLVSTYDHIVRTREDSMMKESSKALADGAARDAFLRSKKIYVRYMSHEMRTPLNCAYMGLKLLDMDMTRHLNVPGNEERLDTLKDITKSCDIALNILNNLLNYDKLQDGNMVLDLRKVNALGFLIDSVNVMILQAKENNVKMLFDVDESFGAEPFGNAWSYSQLVRSQRSYESYVTKDDYIDIDVFKMNKVISILISNAIKYTPTGKNVIIRVRKIPPVYVTSLKELRLKAAVGKKGFSSFLCRARSRIIPTRTASDIDTTTFREQSLKNDPKRRESLLIEIIDEGIGMETGDSERFFREVNEFNPTDLKVTNGSGLGTMITKSIINLHDGGEINVYSEGRGKGSTFTLKLSLANLSGSGSPRPYPEGSRVSEALFSTFADIENHRSVFIEEMEEVSMKGEISRHIPENVPRNGNMPRNVPRMNILPEISASMKSQSSARDPPVARGFHFLVVDDSLLNRKMLCKLLRAEKHSCSEAVDGVDAVKKATHNFVTLTRTGKTVHMYDAILMDFMMPNMDGPTATKAIRELGYKGIIIGATGNALPSDIEHFIAHGADTVLVKPLDIPFLLSTLANLRTPVTISPSLSLVPVSVKSDVPESVCSRSVETDVPEQ